jgi:superfamily II DNA or RNA helicase
MSRKLTTESVITQFRGKHGDKYDYSLVEYVDDKTKVKIICPEHGVFEQSPTHHKQGKGCRVCVGKPIMTKEEVIKQFTEVHGDKYDYSLVEYKTMLTKVKIICPEHGVFEQACSQHKNGTNCPKCTKTGLGGRLTKEEVIKQFTEVHGDKYDYSLVEYKKNHDKVKIICPEHGVFEQTSSHHKKGHGCARCTNDGNVVRVDRIELLKELERNLTLYKADPILLVTILQQAGLTKLIKDGGADFDRLIATRPGSEERVELVDAIIDAVETSEDGDIGVEDVVDILDVPQPVGDVDLDDDDDEPVAGEPKPREGELEPIQSVAREIAEFSENEVMYSWDDEAIQFIEQYFINKLWNSVINGKENPNDIKTLNGKKLLDTIREKFITEYEEVKNLTIPNGYIFKYQPNLMQKLVAYRLIQNTNYGNWSGTGAGKTLSAIYSSRLLKAKNTLILCNNSTVSGWVKAIHSYFSGCTTYVKQILPDLNPTEYRLLDTKTPYIPIGDSNYVILNYETFQLANSELFAKNLTDLNDFDFIIMDEVQYIKQRYSDSVSSRRNNIEKFLVQERVEREVKPYVLAMSATPIINNLYEPIKLIELLTGQEHKELSSVATINNGIKLYQHLTRHGIRYIPNYNIGIQTNIVEVEAPELAGELASINNRDITGMEMALAPTKYSLIREKITKGTMIYTHYVTGLVETIRTLLVNDGWSVGIYTGEDKTGLSDFKNGKVDVLLASAPISTGVDGLQYISDRLIFMCLPWTHAEYMQIVGRIHRQGSNFKSVEVLIPKVNIETEDGKWSWDDNRHNVVEFKATYTDLVLDGVIPNGKIIKPEKMLDKAISKLREWIERLEDNGEVISKRKNIESVFRPDLSFLKKDFVYNENIFRDYNRGWSAKRSATLNAELTKDPIPWHHYHALYREARKTWAERPYEVIAGKIINRPDFVVGDFGCGDNLLKQYLNGNMVHSFDHVAIDDSVVACDISNVPLPDNTLDVAVFSLSLMGTNYVEYIKEGYRTLRSYGKIYICEPLKSWENEQELVRTISDCGFEDVVIFKKTPQFIYATAMKY